VNFPLSPITSQNSKTDVEKIVKFVSSFGPGIKIYIHDFLGKERDQQVYQALKGQGISGI
jgi:reverse gyrase